MTGIAGGPVRKGTAAVAAEGAQRSEAGFHRRLEKSSGSACSLREAFQEVLGCHKVGA